jgi:hypothetical protein
MATFTDWMRLGEARMTSLATLALGAAMACIAPESADAAHPATGERTVSGVRITLGEEGREWTLVPTLLDGKVESFLALREGMPMGENLTAVWYRKVATADGTESWETKAFEEQDQSKAIRAVKQALALGDSTDESWPVAVAAVAAAEPEPMVKGVLESDALAPLVADIEDPQPIVEMLEGAGWKAAWIGPLEGGQLATAEPGAVACPQDVALRTLTQSVEDTHHRVFQSSVLDESPHLALQTGWTDPCPPGVCLPALESSGGLVVLSEGEVGTLWAEGLLWSSDGYLAVPERGTLVTGQVLVAGVIYNTGSMPAVVQSGDGAVTTIPGGTLAVVIDTYSGCLSQCVRLGWYYVPCGGLRPTLRIDARCFCKCWASKQETSQAWLGTLPDCPCQLAMTPSGDPVNPDPTRWFDPGASSQTYHPGASFCMRSIPSSDGGPGQQCCYDTTGALITVGAGAGTPDIVAPQGPLDLWEHWEEDVEPFNYCKAARLLDCYLHHRPPNQGIGCACNPPGHLHCAEAPNCP